MKVKTDIDIRVNIDREEVIEILKRHVTENVKVYGPGEFRVDLGYSYSGVTARFVQAEEEPESVPVPLLDLSEAQPGELPAAVSTPATAEDIGF